MVLHKLMSEPYLKRRFNEGVARGERNNDEKWRDWYKRLLAAKGRGEEFDEPPPTPPNSET